MGQKRQDYRPENTVLYRATQGLPVILHELCHGDYM